MKVYAVSHTWQDIDMSVEIFYSNHKALKRVAELISDEYGVKPDPDKDVEEYVAEYYSWVREENDNTCDNTIAVTVSEATEKMFSVRHSNRFGEDYHLIRSLDDLTGHYNEESTEEDTEKVEKICSLLGIDLELDRQESIEISEVKPDEAKLITL